MIRKVDVLNYPKEENLTYIIKVGVCLTQKHKLEKTKNKKRREAPESESKMEEA